MERIKEYFLISAKNDKKLDEKITEILEGKCLGMGYQPFGSPFYANGRFYQAVVYYGK